MSKVLCEREDLVAIADAIRGKTSETAEMSLAAMPGKINGINGGEIIYEGSCTVTFPNGNASAILYFIKPDSSFTSMNIPSISSSWSIQVLKNTILMSNIRIFGEDTYTVEGQPCTLIKPHGGESCGMVVHSDIVLGYADNAPS